jgi:arsenate reductase
MTKVMFLCTGNTCRSQMAEGFARELGKGLIAAYSAGLMPAGVVHPRAIAVMKETGIDISGQKSKAIDSELLGKMDIIVTLCGNAEASCPMTPPAIKRMHWLIDDPVGAIGTEEEIMKEFRKTRDEIKGKIVDLIKSLDVRG